MGYGENVKTAYHPSGEKITFYEDVHKYETDRCKDFTSVTTFISAYFPEFDTEEVSARYAKKHGMKQQDVITMWEEKKDKACHLGTKVHYFCEMCMEGCDLPHSDNEEEASFFRIAHEAVQRLKKKYTFVGTEEIVFSNKYKIAGMIDLLMRDPINGDLLILDWKTNRRITTENRWQSGFGPIEHLEDTSFNHYSIQLSLYKRIMKEEGYFDNVGDIRLGIIHLTQEKPIWMKVHPLDYEIDLMFEERLATLNAADPISNKVLEGA